MVTGATGNVVTPLLRRLLADPAVTAVTGVARSVLGWRPAHSSATALPELLEDLSARADGSTPALRDGPPVGQLVTDRFAKIRAAAGRPPQRLDG